MKSKQGNKINCWKTSLVCVNETYEDYLNKLRNVPESNYKWLYDIIDGKLEQDKILYSNNKFIIIPVSKWDENINDALKNLHLMGVPVDKNIRTIRDLTSQHIEILEEIKLKGLQIISEKYYDNQNMNDQIKIFFHYKPSTYHLHIHFTNISLYEQFYTTNHYHDFDMVIKNLTTSDTYYQQPMKISYR